MLLQARISIYCASEREAEVEVTLEERLDLAELSCIVEFAEVLCLLREIFALDEGIALVGDEVGGCGVEGGD